MAYNTITGAPNVANQQRLVNMRNDGVDIAIRFGRGNYPGMDVTTLVRDRVIAVCSPDLVRGPEAIRSVDDLAHCRLLHDDDWRGGNEFSWTFWLDRFGITRTRDAGGNSFNRGDLMVQAANNLCLTQLIHGAGNRQILTNRQVAQ